MSEFALQRIAENKRTRATSLDLGNCGLMELPLELRKCVWLEELALSNLQVYFDFKKGTWEEKYSLNEGKLNNLVSISGIKYLIKLKRLIVSGDNMGGKWQLSDLSPLSDLIALQYLDFSSTQVSNLTPLVNLTALQHLECAATQVSDLTPLSNLTALQHLDCYSTEVSDLTPLTHLSTLHSLFCSSTLVTDLSPLSNVCTLKILDCANSMVADLLPLANLTALQYLACDSTKVNDLMPLAKLAALQQVSCSVTQVNDLTPLANLITLRQIECSSTQVSDLSPLLPLIKKGIQVIWSKYEDGINVGNCPLTNPPPEVVQQGNEAILRYFEQIEAQHGTVELYEAKILIVGEGKTGKTTLFEKLKDDSYDPIQNPTDETHGINIEEGLPIHHASLGEQIFHANLWDFGGQELQYMTHQFFLTPRALYVLLMDARAESPNLPYWFKIISLLGKAAEDSAEKVRLLLVFNKRRGGTGQRPLYEEVLKYYAEHLDVRFVEVDLAVNENNFHLLRSVIEEQLVTLPIVKSQLPRQWKPIREALREESKKRPYITTERLAEICSAHQVTDERDQWQLSDYLHQLGSLLHFQNDKELMDLVILSPQWAVKGVYSFLKDGRIEKQAGRFTNEDIFDILKDKEYTRIDAQKVLQLMTKNNFDICYEASPENYVAAQLLPDQAPSYAWLNRESLQFRYQYPIMPKGLMSRLIVRLSEFIERDEESQEQVVWKKGVVLRIPYNSQECRIRLLEDNAESQDGLRQIIIEVLGEPAYRKYALQRVREEVEELHRRWFRSIRADEMVPCCCDTCLSSSTPRLYKLEDLLKLKKKRPDARCFEGDDVQISVLLEGVYEKSEIAHFEKAEMQQAEKRGDTYNFYNHGQMNLSKHLGEVEYNPSYGIPPADFDLLQQQIQDLAATQKAVITALIEADPAPHTEADKQTIGNQIIAVLQGSAIPIAQNLAASGYYDLMKKFLGLS